MLRGAADLLLIYLRRPGRTKSIDLLRALAEFKHSIICKHQAEGIAKACVVYKGRAKALTNDQLVQAQAWVNEGVLGRRLPDTSKSDVLPCTTISNLRRSHNRFNCRHS